MLMRALTAWSTKGRKTDRLIYTSRFVHVIYSSCIVLIRPGTLTTFQPQNRIGNLLRCNFLLRNHFRGAGMNHFLAAMGLSNFLLAVLRVPCNLGHQDQQSKFLSVVEHCRVLASRFSILVFSILSGFTNFGPYFWPYVIWSGSRLNLCQSLRTTHPLGGFSFHRVNFMKPFHESDKLLFEPTFD